MSFDLNKNREALERSQRARAFAQAIRSGVAVDAAGYITAMERLGAENNLIFEIGCCRLMLARLMDMDAIDARDPRDFARVVRSITSALTGAVGVQRQIEMEGGSTTSEALTSLLLELGGTGDAD